VVSVSDTALNGLSSWSTSFGRTASSVAVLNGNGSKTVTVTNPDGSTVLQTYANGLLMSSTHSVLGTTTYTYDPHNRLASQQTTVNGQQRTTSFSYNNNDQTTSIQDPASRITSYTYDSMGRMTKMVLPDGRSVNYKFSPTGEMTNVSGANTYPVNYSYDGAGRMKTLTDGNGSVTTWNYSADRGFMTSKVYADGGAVSYTYNPDGSVATRNWARGIVTTYTYDAAGDVTGMSYSGNSAPAVSFTRDLFGRPTTVTDGTGSRTITYNNDMTLASETIPHILNHSMAYDYDNLGRRTAMSLQNGGTALNTANYTYDGMSRLASVGNGTNTASYTRISGSSLLSTTTVGNLTTTRTYDNLNRLTSISSTSSQLPVTSYQYQYNNSDQRSKVTLSDGSYWLYKYDAYGQVTAAHKYTSGNAPVPGQQFDYAFDPIGNRTTSTSTETGTSVTRNYTSNQLNQYTAIDNPAANPTYDDDGNTVNCPLSSGNWTMTWDAENRLSSATNGSQTLQFKYDYMSRRVEKTVVGGSDEKFVYDGFLQIEKLDAANSNAILKKRIWGAEGKIIADVNSTGTPFYAVGDENKNITEYMDASGTIQGHYEFSPFGKITVASGSSPDSFDFRFSSEYFDQESGLVYYNFRYYNPELGRWLSRDPIREKSGWNLYHMCLNMPTTYFDLNGLAVWRVMGYFPNEGEKDLIKKESKRINQISDYFAKYAKKYCTDEWTFLWNGEKVDKETFIKNASREKINVIDASGQTYDETIKTINNQIKNHTEKWDVTTFEQHSYEITDAETGKKAIDWGVVFQESQKDEPNVKKLVEKKLDDVDKAIKEIKPEKGNVVYMSCYLEEDKRKEMEFGIKEHNSQKDGVDIKNRIISYGSFEPTRKPKKQQE